MAQLNITGPTETTLAELLGLPTNAATEANQTTELARLQSIITALAATLAVQQAALTAANDKIDVALVGGLAPTMRTPADAQSLAMAFVIQAEQMVYGGPTSLLQLLRTPTIFKVVALGAATAETTIWTPASGKKFRLMGFILTCGAASTLTFKDGTGLTTIFAARGATDTPISPTGLGNGILSGAADRLLTVTRGTSCTLDGVVFGTEE